MPKTTAPKLHIPRQAGLKYDPFLTMIEPANWPSPIDSNRLAAENFTHFGWHWDDATCGPLKHTRQYNDAVLRTIAVTGSEAHGSRDFIARWEDLAACITDGRFIDLEPKIQHQAKCAFLFRFERKGRRGFVASHRWHVEPTPALEAVA